MSDDLRERIARALADHNVDASRVGWESRTMGWYRDAADAVLTVVQPVIEQAERERDEWEATVRALNAALIEEVDNYDRVEQERNIAEARVVTLEAVLDRIAHAALGEQDTPAERCPTCGSDDPTRQQGLPHTDLHAQVRCRDRWHAVPSVEGNP